ASGASAGAWLADRLLEACTQPPGLAHLERRDLADELAASRNFDLGLTAPPLQTSMPQIGNGFAEILSGLAQAAVLARYRWWAPLLVAGARASTHLPLRRRSLVEAWASESVTEEQRHVDYAYRLAVDAPAAKEIRLFGLADWAADRFAAHRRRLTEALFRERRLRMRPMRWSLAAIVMGNGVVFWSLARDAVAGGLSLRSFVAFAQAPV